jgi:hypothetical protein
VRVHVTLHCDACGESHGDIDIGPDQCRELKTAPKVGKFIGEIIVLFARQAFEHVPYCSKAKPKAETP